MRILFRVPRYCVLGCLAAMAWASPGVASEPVAAPVTIGDAADDAEQPPLVVAELVADHDAVSPGQSITIGVRMTMRPGWHIYWRNPGDSGQATRIDVSATGIENLDAGPIRWPMPRRYEIDGGMVNFGYGGTVMLSRKITVPEDLGDAEQLTLAVQARWLVCDDAACLPGGEDLTLILPITDQPARNAEHAGTFTDHEATLPVSAQSVSDRVAIRTAGGMDPATGKGQWTATLAWRGPVPEQITWFPAADAALMLDSASLQTEAGVTRITQPASRLVGIEPGGDTLVMLVTWEEPDGSRRGVDLPVPFFTEPAGE